MISYQQEEEIYRLKENGMSITEIASRINVSRQTVYNYLENKIVVKEIKINSDFIPAKIYPFINNIDSVLRRGVTNRTKLYQELVRKGYEGSYSQLSRYLNDHERNNTNKKYRTSIIRSTLKGEEAQVDWGTFKKIKINGIPTQLYCFVYILSYSRMLFIEFTIRQNLQMLEQCHIHAFKKLGIPKYILYDNMKTVVIKREKNNDKRDSIYFNKGFVDFASYYGYEIRVCSPYWPRSKGKVEAGVKYIKSNFMNGMKYGRDYKSLEEVNRLGKEWVDNIANNRIHTSTKEKPIERWKTEKQVLSFPNDIPDYKSFPLAVRNSTKDQLIFYKNYCFSVPKEYARRKLCVRELYDDGEHIVQIFNKNILIARHVIKKNSSVLISNPEHYAVDNRTFSSRKTKKVKNFINRRSNIKIRSLNYYKKIFG